MKNSTLKKVVICFCNSNREWGGGERWHLESALHMAARGYQVIIAAGKDTPLWKKASIELAQQPELQDHLSLACWGFGNRDFLNPFRRRAFRKFLQNNHVSHLVLGLPADLKTGIMAASKLGICKETVFSDGNRPTEGIRVFYRRGSAIPVKANFLNRYLYSRLTGLIVNSQETARCVLQNQQLIAPERVHVIYNGLDILAFDAALGQSKLENMHMDVVQSDSVDFINKAASPACLYNLLARRSMVSSDSARFNSSYSDSSTFVIGNAGRLSQQKAQKYLLHMSVALKEQGFAHTLLIAGTGELEHELFELAKQLHLKNSGAGAELCFTGFMHDLGPFWQATDLFVLSSIWEGFGYVLAEAMLAEKPLLAFDCNSMPELVKPGVNGVLLSPPFEYEDDAAVGRRLAAAVLELAANPVSMRELGRKGRKYCEDNFDQREAMFKLERLLLGVEDIKT